MILLLIVVKDPPQKEGHYIKRKIIVDLAYLLMLIWSLSLLGYNPENMIVFVDAVIVVVVIAFFYIGTWQKLLVYYGAGLIYLFFLTPYVSRASNYLPLVTTSILTMLAMFAFSRILHQYYLNHFTMKEELKKKKNALEEQLEISIKKLRSKEKRVNQEIIKCLVKGIDVYDGYTRGHSENVANYARRISKILGMSYEEQEELYLAGWVHDVGKILVPAQILNKPMKLTDEEMDIIKKHSTFGYELLSESDSLSKIANWVLHHHERWDGKGYPEGLSKDKIPIGAQILAVADAYDAITSNRIYRDKRPLAEAVQEVQACSGTQFAPKIVQTFVEEMESKIPIHESINANE